MPFKRDAHHRPSFPHLGKHGAIGPHQGERRGQQSLWQTSADTVATQGCPLGSSLVPGGEAPPKDTHLVAPWCLGEKSWQLSGPGLGDLRVPLIAEESQGTRKPNFSLLQQSSSRSRRAGGALGDEGAISSTCSVRFSRG